MTRKLAAPSRRESQETPARHPYEIGYGKPPKHGQFRPGQSGNRKGRPKHRRNLRSVVEDAMNEKIPVRSGSRERMMTATEALVHTTLTRALKGDQKAVATMLALMRACAMLDEEAVSTASAPLTENDTAVIEEFFRRQQNAPAESDHASGAPEQQPLGLPAADSDAKGRKK
jgi:hypothetical protein